MTKKIGKVKKQVRATNRVQKKLQSESNDVPRTMIFCKSGASASVRQLVEDFKSMMEPYTTSSLKCSKRNKMKNLIDNATTLMVKYIIYFTENTGNKKSPNWDESINYEIGGVYCHVICVPHGPTFTYKVKEYSLKKDVQNANGYCMNSNFLQIRPLLILNDFVSQSKDNYLKAVSSSWQNMVPSINVNKDRIQSLRRAVVLSRYDTMPLADEKTQADWGEVMVLRHYNIKLENRELNKSIRKLGVGAASRNVKIPNLSKYSSIEDYINQTGNMSESDMSDVDEAATVELVESTKELPGCSGKTAIRMMEVGPRITMQLLKIEAGVHSGAVLHHRYVKKTPEEIFNNEKRRQERLKLKEARRKLQEKNVALKKKSKDGNKDRKKKDSRSEEEEVDDEEAEVEADQEHNDEEMEVDGEETVENIEGGDEEEDEEDVVEGEEDDESEGIEEVNDSMDEDDLDMDDGENADSDDESECLNDIDSGDEVSDGDDGMEDVDDLSEEDDVISDIEDDDNSDFEVKEDIKSLVHKQTVGKKRPQKVIEKSINKKRKL